jgi:hypothetical protein
MRLPALLAAAAVIAFASAALAKDYVLTIGGGYSPSGNQVSLEKNVLFFERVLTDAGQKDAEHTILFADGDNPHRDLQYIDPDAPLPRAYDLLARVFNETDHLDERYRDHVVPNAAGATTPENLRNWFKTVAPKLTQGDRVILYATAHGGSSGDKKRPRNTTLYLWDREEITVEEFTEELDRLPPEVPVVAVMVQCHSGGFADLIFDDGNEEKGLAGHDRCGFFATIPSRSAAGCTPDIEEADYREYSSEFWAAILGRTRAGESVEPADYDGDGAVSFAEAHAYVLVHSDTIDIPVKTTDVFLRAYASEQPKRPPVLASRDDEKGEDISVTALRPVEPLTADSPIEALLAAADPAEQIVITGLSERLGFSGSNRAAETRDESKRTESERRGLRGRIGRLNGRAGSARGEIESAVLAQWPELAGAWNPVGRQIINEQVDAVVDLIESHPRFKEWERLEDEIDELEEQRLDLERRWAKCQRLLRTLENIALAHNLPLSADSDLLTRYDRLRAAEHATLKGE